MSKQPLVVTTVIFLAFEARTSFRTWFSDITFPETVFTLIFEDNAVSLWFVALFFLDRRFRDIYMLSIRVCNELFRMSRTLCSGMHLCEPLQKHEHRPHMIA